MPGDASKLPDQALKVPVEERAGSPPDDRLAVGLSGFGLVGILAILVILAGNFLFAPLSAILVLVWVRWSCTPWREIGYVRPRRWIGTLAVGITFGIAFKFLMKSIVMPLLGADPINQAFHYLAGNRVARYVPALAGLPYPTKDSPTLTIRHLLTHSEGFPEDNRWATRSHHAPANESQSRADSRSALRSVMR